MAGEVSRINGRKGGRPKGSRSAATLERDAIAAAYRQRIMRAADRLFNAQLSLAEGCAFLMRVEKGKDKKHVVVTSAEEICRYLDGDCDPDDYYYITTQKPDNQAIVDMLNRSLGKPTEVVEHTGKDGGPVSVTFRVIQDAGRSTP